MLAILIVAICVTTSDADGRTHVLCRSYQSEPAPIAECEAKRAQAIGILKGEPRLSFVARCAAPGDPA